MSDAIYLVLLGTSRQGMATIEALKGKGAKHIYATSRNPEGGASKKLVEDLGVTKVLKADYNDSESLKAAIVESKATRIWFATDYWSIPKPTREKEYLLGKAVIDSIVSASDDTNDQVEHIVYSSVGDADNCPTTIEHFWSKADVEKYLAQTLEDKKTTWAVIRPVAFFDNLDDPKNSNPLTKGKLSFFGRKGYKFKLIATEDIGKGSAVLLMEPQTYAGKIIEAAGGEHTGEELAEILSEVSGVKCTFKTFPPRFCCG